MDLAVAFWVAAGKWWLDGFRSDSLCGNYGGFITGFLGLSTVSRPCPAMFPLFVGKVRRCGEAERWSL